MIGGGLAGSAVAIALANAGRSVTLIEKSAAAHPKVCGEFLSHEALHYLAALQMDPLTLGAVPIEYVRLVAGKRVAQAKLPFAALSLSRERLDEALLARAASAGAHVLRGRRVQSLKAGPVWQAKLDTGETLDGRSAFLANGKHDLFGWNRPPGKQNDLIAFKMYWRLASAQARALDRHVELVLFPGGYAGLQPVEDGQANLCLLVQRAVFQRLGSQWSALLDQISKHAPHMAARLAGASAVWARPLSLSAIPYGYVRAHAPDNLWRLGDQSAVIPSLAGDGMSIALHSAQLAAETYRAGGTAEQFQRRLAHDVSRQVSLATLVSRSFVQPAFAPVLSAVACAWPGLLAKVATSTRVRMRQATRRT